MYLLDVIRELETIHSIIEAVVHLATAVAEPTAVGLLALRRPRRLLLDVFERAGPNHEASPLNGDSALVRHVAIDLRKD